MILGVFPQGRTPKESTRLPRVRVPYISAATLSRVPALSSVSRWAGRNIAPGGPSPTHRPFKRAPFRTSSTTADLGVLRPVAGPITASSAVGRLRSAEQAVGPGVAASQKGYDHWLSHREAARQLEQSCKAAQLKQPAPFGIGQCRRSSRRSLRRL